jgi:NADH-quinone oxidoreductase subunit E
MECNRNLAKSDPEYGRADKIIQSHLCEESALITILQEIQDLYDYLPAWALRYVSEKLDVPLIQVYGVASFYDAFHLTPRGKHLVRVCLGTACYLRGSARVLETLERELGIEEGETTPDLEFSLQAVRCLGACALAPVVTVDDQYFAKMTSRRVSRVLNQVQGKNEKD